MIAESTAFLPMWILLSAAFGFIASEAYGDSVRRRKCLEQANADLREQLEQTHDCIGPLGLELRWQRGVIHDT
jgi:hypothetical protein